MTDARKGDDPRTWRRRVAADRLEEARRRTAMVLEALDLGDLQLALEQGADARVALALAEVHARELRSQLQREGLLALVREAETAYDVAWGRAISLVPSGDR